MRIQHNISALNTHRNLASNNSATSKALEKLSSGYKINRAGDDAAGLAISEKMRGQIRGLDMASKNSQDGISLIQTTEGALAESHSILQRMRELAVQASNDTNVSVDRGEIQKEINQLTSELNRIGNTTEFNTQKLLQGDKKQSLEETGLTSKLSTMLSGTTVDVNATQTLSFTALSGANHNGASASVLINGEKLTVNFKQNTTLSGTSATKVDLDSLKGNSITLEVKGTVTTANADDAIKSALDALIKNNEKLAGNVDVAAGAIAGNVVITLKNELGGQKGSIAGSQSVTGVTNPVGTAGTASFGTTTTTAATQTLTTNGLSGGDLSKLVGKGMTIGDQQIEFYDATAGAYNGEAIGVDLSRGIKATTAPTPGNAAATAIADQLAGKLDGIKVTASAAGVITFASETQGKGTTIDIKDGGVKNNFEVTFQVGANTGQAMKIEIGDMRANALGVVGKAGDEGFTSEFNVNNGTDNKNVEAALDVSSHEKATAAIKTINDALEKVSAQRSNLGAFQNRLEHTINNLGAASENLTAAESRIRDTDMAKEMMEFTKNNILTQAAQSMLAQANQQPQGVLQLLG